MPPALGDEPVDAVEPPIHDGIAIVGSLLQGFSPHEAQNAIELIAGGPGSGVVPWDLVPWDLVPGDLVPGYV
ncbi:MAG: hypothetical protein ACI8XD_000833 [Thermoproteota archaeon]